MPGSGRAGLRGLAECVSQETLQCLGLVTVEAFTFTSCKLRAGVLPDHGVEETGVWDGLLVL